MARQKKSGREFINVSAHMDGDPGTRARMKEIEEAMGRRSRNDAHDAAQREGMKVVEGDFSGVRDPAADRELREAVLGETYQVIASSFAATMWYKNEIVALFSREKRVLDAFWPDDGGAVPA